MARAIATIAVEVFCTLTFEYAYKSGVNPGIIASCFSVNIPFTAIVFYFVYGNKLTIRDAIGGLLIIGSIILISLGGGNTAKELTP